MSHWCVIRTRSRWEKKVVRVLQQKGIETFCPLLQAKHKWSDRMKTVEKPLLETCVFVRASEAQRTEIRRTDGVVNFVYRSGKPLFVKEKIIQDIRRFQQVYPSIQVIEYSSERNSTTSRDIDLNDQMAILRVEALSILLIGLPFPVQQRGETKDKI